MEHMHSNMVMIEGNNLTCFNTKSSSGECQQEFTAIKQKKIRIHKVQMYVKDPWKGILYQMWQQNKRHPSCIEMIMNVIKSPADIQDVLYTSKILFILLPHMMRYPLSMFFLWGNVPLLSSIYLEFVYSDFLSCLIAQNASWHTTDEDFVLKRVVLLPSVVILLCMFCCELIHVPTFIFNCFLHASASVYP